MHRTAAIALCLGSVFAGIALPADDRTVGAGSDNLPSVPLRLFPPNTPSEPTFSWQVQQLSDGAELVTLFGRFDHDEPSGEGKSAQRQRRHLENDSIPVLAVLRDTLGGESYGEGRRGTRLLSLWLFTQSTPTVGRRILAAVPFYYRKTADSDPPAQARLTRLADLGAPEGHPFSSIGHEVVQWTLLDTIGTPVRSSSRTYRTNELNQKRLYLEEASTFLRLAQESDAASPLSPVEIDHITARLRLLKLSLGGLTGDRHLDAVAEAAEVSRHMAEARNWEILRQAAEKTGLIFEPLEIGDTTDTAGEYAMLWYSPPITASEAPEDRPAPVDSSPATRGVFKVLGISDVRKGVNPARLRQYAELRAFDDDGALLPRGERGATERELIPLAVYSLDYDRQPLVLIDFQNIQRTKRREISQRVVEDVIHNVVGLSYMTNWYFFAGKALLTYIESRRGATLDAGNRADCYARFRVALMLDKGFDSDFRSKLTSGLSRMSINPLEVAPEWELQAAKLNYSALEYKIGESSFPTDLDKQRRFELAASRESSEARLRDSLLHLVSFGAYTHRQPASESTRMDVEEERQRLATLDFLEKSTKGVDPGLADNHAEIAQATAHLAKLMGATAPTAERRRAAMIASRLSTSRDAKLVAGSSDIATALASVSPSGAKGE